jgi:glucosamine-6-phosphate deaminase
MRVEIAKDRKELGTKAAAAAADAIKNAIQERGSANIIVATGASQFDTLAALAAYTDIPWGCVTGFHLDEYIGIDINHPASFRKYLRERFVSKLPFKAFHYINAEVENVEEECSRLASLISKHPIDVALVGIGENGHLAFNDPPANFETEQPYLIVNLDEACCQQQVGEGWFKSLAEVPKQAVSMSVRQIMKSASIICSVPDDRKAEAVRGSVEGPITVDVPASILQSHPAATVYLDPPAASLLNQKAMSV